MGRFVNPDNSAFQKAVNSEIYVDKTGFYRIPIKLLIPNRHLYATAVQDVLENLLRQICWLPIIVRDVIQKICLRI